MDDDTSFSLHRNAKRAAERMIEAGTAPSMDYRLRTREDGRFEIVWRSGCESPTTAEIGDEITAATAAAEPVETETTIQSIEPAPGEDPWPSRTQVKIRNGNNRRLTGTVLERVDPTHWRVRLDFAANGDTHTYDGADLEVAAAVSEPWAESHKKRSPAGAPKRSKAAELDAAAARGVMPEKPIVTSKANPHYQKRFDHLAALAAAGDWGAVQAYEVKGINSYAKMVRQYRDRLLTAHSAAAP
jgi:hypothetical protein